MYLIFNLYANYCQVLISTCYEFLNTFLFFYFKKVNYLFQQFRKDKNSFMLTHIFMPFSSLHSFLFIWVTTLYYFTLAWKTLAFVVCRSHSYEFSKGLFICKYICFSFCSKISLTNMEFCIDEFLFQSF